MLEDGKTQMEVAKLMKYSQGIASNLELKYKQTTSVENVPRSGRQEVQIC